MLLWWFAAGPAMAFVAVVPSPRRAVERQHPVVYKFKTGNIMQEFEQEQLEKLDTDKPYFSPGDTLTVAVEITEGTTTRIQNFAGVCIKRHNAGVSSTFTVRKIASGVGVERTFPLYSPIVKKITVTRRGSVRRAKLYYLRKLTGKSARLKEQVRGLAYVARMEQENKDREAAKQEKNAKAAEAADEGDES
ncbi:hypothetical protein CTAYLR_001189 [Chrysophaeum taylorii]|uniref:50S ribosomal protein L19, chloroplastic n=1 Tax=Chrysophaeum taylorii TaxID=2483200 RepID=A0AAD7UQJ9_9STRA|nr:hypothetical protein CTAYLR_001189 [Chrysophaeum taylorii]